MSPTHNRIVDKNVTSWRFTNTDTNTLLKINKIYLWKSNTQNTNIAVQFRWILVFFWESKSSRFSTILAWQTNRVFLLFGGVWTSFKSCSKDDEVIRVTDNGTRTNDISTVFTSSRISIGLSINSPRQPWGRTETPIVIITNHDLNIYEIYLMKRKFLFHWFQPNIKSPSRP